MEPFYFGKSPTMLFGAYHQPPSGAVRDTGIVLCYPMGQEYIRSHRAFLRLALLLSAKGFHVLRFDYSCSGDSEGDCHQAGIHQWVDDISTAVEELKGGSGVHRICLVGLRLGGSLCMIAGSKRGDIDGIVLWDPVVNGRDYARELTSLHKEWLRGSFAKSRSQTGGERREVLGFPLTDLMLKDLDGIDLLSVQRRPAGSMLLVTTGEAGDCGRLQQHLQSMNACLRYEHITAPRIWVKAGDEVAKGVVPVQVLERIVSWMSEVFS